jgi:hypothetical protein
MASGRPLDEVVGGRIYRGVLTGLNEAFIVDQTTRDRLVAADPGCAPLLRKMLRGQDLRPWYQENEGNWLIVMPNGFTRQAFGQADEAQAWSLLSERYPALTAHLAPFTDAARKRTDQGEFWWELRSCDYYPAFDQPKIFLPDIAKLPRFSWDEEGAYVNNTGYMLPAEPWMLAVLSSRVVWFCLSQISTPLRLRGGLWQFRCFQQFMGRLPIPAISEQERDALAQLAQSATALARERYTLHGMVRHRLIADFPSPAQTLNNRLTEWWTLDFTVFRGELRKALKADIPVKERADWEQSLADWQRRHADLTARLVAIETEIDDRVNRLFNLTAPDLRLLGDHSRHAMIDYPYGAV